MRITAAAEGIIVVAGYLVGSPELQLKMSSTKRPGVA